MFQDLCLGSQISRGRSIFKERATTSLPTQRVDSWIQIAFSGYAVRRSWLLQYVLSRVYTTSGIQCFPSVGCFETDRLGDDRFRHGCWGLSTGISQSHRRGQDINAKDGLSACKGGGHCQTSVKLFQWSLLSCDGRRYAWPARGIQIEGYASGCRPCCTILSHCYCISISFRSFMHSVINVCFFVCKGELPALPLKFEPGTDCT